MDFNGNKIFEGIKNLLDKNKDENNSSFASEIKNTKTSIDKKDKKKSTTIELKDLDLKKIAVRVSLVVLVGFAIYILNQDENKKKLFEKNQTVSDEKRQDELNENNSSEDVTISRMKRKSIPIVERTSDNKVKVLNVEFSGEKISESIEIKKEGKEKNIEVNKDETNYESKEEIKEEINGPKLNEKISDSLEKNENVVYEKEIVNDNPKQDSEKKEEIKVQESVTLNPTESKNEIPDIDTEKMNEKNIVKNEVIPIERKVAEAALTTTMIPEDSLLRIEEDSSLISKKIAKKNENTDLSNVSSIIKKINKNSLTKIMHLPNYLNQGRGLVYNCSEKYWVCLERDDYFQCRDHMLWAKELSKELKCIPTDVFATVEDCIRAQKKKIESADGPDICKH